MNNTIIYVGNFNLPEGNAASLRVLGNSKVLNLLGFDVLLLSKDKKCFLSSNIDASINSNLEIEILQKPITPIEFLISFKKFKKIISQSKNVDSVILYNFPAMSMFFAILYCKKYKIKCIADLTEYYDSNTGNYLFDLIKNIDSFLRMKCLVYFLDSVITINKNLTSLYDNKLNAITVPPLVDLAEDKWKNDVIEIPEVMTFTFFGSKSKKNEKEYFSIILESFVNLKKYNFEIKLIGVEEEDLLIESDMVRYWLNELNGKVHFYGRLGHKETLTVVKNSDFTIFYRHINLVTHYGFPTKFVESITCGTPVITNLTGVLGDYFENNFGFILGDNVTKELEIVLNLPRLKIDAMKSYCKSSEKFNFKRYEDDFRKLFN